MAEGEPVDSGRLSRMRRSREVALERCSLIAALTTARVRAGDRLRDLQPIQTEQLTDLLHEFAYYGRKAIELAARQGVPHVMERANRPRLMGGPKATSPEHPFPSTYSVSFVLGRLIHSDTFSIEWHELPTEHVDGTVYDSAPWGFTVASDWDQGKTDHFIFIEFLLEAYLEVDEPIGHYLTWQAARSQRDG